ncbi:ATP-binding protein [Pseudomonas sp. Eth.TT006]
MEQRSLLYDARFLESYAGAIVSDPATAIVELVANCWDAYATEVDITWADAESNRQFIIRDNGHGMTRIEFQHIWRTIAYNRLSVQGAITAPPSEFAGGPRTVFGKNGKGRFASFCFADDYLISSRKDGQEFVCRVYRTVTEPLVLEEVSFTASGVIGHGTEIIGNGSIPTVRLSEEQARELIGSRFLANPAFKVSINNRPITFSDIPELLSCEVLDVPNLGKVSILHIDTKKADRTTKQHGIAWWVQNRAVGECKWSRSDYERVLDGRTSEAKRFTFIVQADFLNEHDAVAADWSGFKEKNNAWEQTRLAVQDRIRKIILDSGESEREIKRAAVIERVGNDVNTLSLSSKERVESFINEVVNNCPNFGEAEIVQISTILAKLEKAKSRYGLLDLLHKCEPHDYDALHDILSQWTVGMAKLVLDEIQNRLKLIAELRTKIQISGIDEVHELQPLFERGLWMFGAQFESIEFTSNKGMTSVIRKLFGDINGKGSLNRPDFVALPDCSVSFFARSSYDNEYNEDGIAHVVIVDLKTTDLPLGAREKSQIWKYVKELKAKGHIRQHTRVDGFVLGSIIEQGEDESISHGDEVKITPLLYETILLRAEKRLLNLFSKVKEAPFLVEQQAVLSVFLNPIPVKQGDMLAGE